MRYIRHVHLAAHGVLKSRPYRRHCRRAGRQIVAAGYCRRRRRQIDAAFVASVDEP